YIVRIPFVYRSYIVRISFARLSEESAMRIPTVSQLLYSLAIMTSPSSQVASRCIGQLIH
ncbi:MAG TPA: hypothetical protein VIL90_09740, partial [Puia sp.]